MTKSTSASRRVCSGIADGWRPAIATFEEVFSLSALQILSATVIFCVDAEGCEPYTITADKSGFNSLVHSEVSSGVIFSALESIIAVEKPLFLKYAAITAIQKGGSIAEYSLPRF